MKVKIILSIIALTLIFGAFGQNNSVIDSLENILKTAKADTTKVNCLNSLSSEYMKISDYKMSMQYAESALVLANTLDYKKGIADSYYNIGNTYKNQGKYQEALNLYLNK
jgi:tetratricopeptide (TPR) repeat protein